MLSIIIFVELLFLDIVTKITSVRGIDILVYVHKDCKLHKVTCWMACWIIHPKIFAKTVY